MRTGTVAVAAAGGGAGAAASNNPASHMAVAVNVSSVPWRDCPADVRLGPGIHRRPEHMSVDVWHDLAAFICGCDPREEQRCSNHCEKVGGVCTLFVKDEKQVSASIRKFLYELVRR